MIALHPNILMKDGKKEFAVLPFEEFTMLQEELRDFEDLKDLRKAKVNAAKQAGMTLAEAKGEWGFEGNQ